MSKAKAAMMPEYRRLISGRKAEQRKLIGYTYCSKCGKRCNPGPHHPNGRRGNNLFDFILIGWDCCHKAIHEAPRAARAIGLLAPIS